MENIKGFLASKFKEYFNEEPNRFFVSPGRLEIIGNHTDHNNGFAVVAGASMFVKSAVKATDDDIITLFSEGHDLYKVNAIDSKPNPNLFCTTDSLIAGIVHGFLSRGLKVGGFKAWCTSDVLEGSGISSSAAFELLICTIVNELYNEGKVDKIELVKIAQEAESLFFGKPCGLLDQIGSAFGGISFVDFKDPKNPIVKNTKFPFDLKILLTNPGGSHAGLTEYYASIPLNMHHVAEVLGADVLRNTTKDDFDEFVKNYPSALTEMEINRAKHFYGEVDRVIKAYDAINANDKDTFIKMINGSGQSSSTLLCNTQVPGRYDNSPERALTIAREVAPLSGHRVHGGGFMGTIISFLRSEDYDKVVDIMKKTFGEKNAIDVSIPPVGATEIKEEIKIMLN